MPNGPTHDFITIVSGAALAPAALQMNLPDMVPANAFVLLGSYLASGLLFSPDLDLRSSPYRRWRGMRWVWIPYQRMVPHRSWVSHSFLFGPLIRVVYFAVVLSLLTLTGLALLNLLVPVDQSGVMLGIITAISSWLTLHPWTTFYAAVGFVLGGAAHTVADLVSTSIKRRF
ncbi:MAG: metal-binding protein [Chloroflexota bacterium]|nr:metal-binding protein [Chloroflexota bacterium]